MINVILEHKRTEEGRTLQLPADWGYARVSSYLKATYPQWRFVESW